MSIADSFDPRSIAEADVYKAGVVAARLARTDEGIVFSYREDYLQRPMAPPVATTLPLSEAPTTTTAGAVPAFFAGLLPEGRRLTALRNAVKTSPDDELSLLLAVGADPVGDVQVLPAGQAPVAAEAGTVTQGSFEEVDFTELLETSGVGDPSALAGVQDKVSGRMLTIPIAYGGRAHFLKFEVPEFPHVIANEAYFLAQAARLPHPVTRAHVVHDRRERPALLVERFDRVIGPAGAVTSRAVEDASQLLGLYPADKYNVTMERVARAVAAACSAGPLALRAVFLQVCFAWLTGNGDLHAKNISVLDHDGEWRVAPTYDVPSTVPYRDHTMALSLGGRRDGLSRRRLLEFGVDIGLPERAAQRTINDALAATETVFDDITGGAIGFDPRRRRDLLRVLHQRRRVTK